MVRIINGMPPLPDGRYWQVAQVAAGDYGERIVPVLRLMEERRGIGKWLLGDRLILLRSLPSPFTESDVRAAARFLSKFLQAKHESDELFGRH